MVGREPGAERRKKMKEEATENKVTKDEAKIGMELRTLDLDALVKHPNHPRQHIGDLQTLESSIRRDGIQEPLLVATSKDGRFWIIDGVRRAEVVRKFGWKQIDCLIRKEVAPAAAAHFSYVKNTERNSLTAIEVARHIKMMMNEFGFSLRELELKGYGSPTSISAKLKLIELPDSVQGQIENGALTPAHGLQIAKLNTAKEQERMAKRITANDLSAKRAANQIDGYLKKLNKIAPERKAEDPDDDIPGVYFKDARSMSELPDKSVHLIVSSPPSGIGKEYEIGQSYLDTLENARGVLQECARVLTSGGIMALNISDINNFKGKSGKNEFRQIQLMGNFYQSFLRRFQIYLTDLVIWKKPIAWETWKNISNNEDTVHTSYRIMDNFEPIYIYRKKGEKILPEEEIILQSRITKEQWAQYVNAVWEIQPVQDMKGHPCIWPEELPRRLIQMYSYVGDVVLDPFLGSGTTVKVARDLDRQGIGYERSLQYKPMIMEKLGISLSKEPATPEKSMVEYHKQMTGKPMPEFFGSKGFEDLIDEAEENQDKQQSIELPEEIVT